MLGTLIPLVLLATAASTGDVAVTLTGGRGSCGVHGSFSAPVTLAVAWQVLTDYDSLGRFVHSIEASRLERQADGCLLVRQVAVGGTMFVKRRVSVLLELDLKQDHRIAFRDVLGKDFESYAGEWRLSADSVATRIEYDLAAEPRGFMARAFCRGALSKTAKELLAEVREEMLRRARSPR